MAVARAQFIASDPEGLHPGIPPQFGVLFGSMVDLACEPQAGSDTDETRFPNHGMYVSMFTQAVSRLQQQGFLLAPEAEALLEQAAASEVGKPGTCAE
jgi:hypothetical protein